VDASQFRGPSLALRIAALLVGTQTVLASGTSALILLIAIGGRGGFSTLGTGTIDNQAQWVLIFGLATAAIAGTGGATVVGLWRGRVWATFAAFVVEVAWAVVVIVGVNGHAYPTLDVVILLSPTLLVGLVLATRVRRRPDTLPDR
jgi:hypothetical protein